MSYYYPQAAVRLKVWWEHFERRADLEAIRILENELLQNPSDFFVQAKTVTVDNNGYAEADTFQLTIDYKQFPFDPRTMRSVHVTIYMEDVRATEQIVPRDPPRNRNAPNNSNVVFVGHADESEIVFDDDMREVRMSGRDYTGLLLDTSRILVDDFQKGQPEIIGRIKPPRLSQLAAREGIKTVADLLQALLHENRSTQDLAVIPRFPDNFQIPAPDSDEIDNLNNNSYWHIMSTLANRAALIVFVERYNVILTQPRNFYNDLRSVQMVYGINIKRLNFSRALGRQRDFNLKVITTDPKSNKVFKAFLPKDSKDDRFRQLFGMKDKEGRPIQEDYKRPVVREDGGVDYVKVEPILWAVPNRGGLNTDRLIKIGEKAYEEISRQQLQGGLVTHEMQLPQVISKQNEAQFGTLEEARDNRRRLKANQISFADLTTGSGIEVVLDHKDLSLIRSLASESERKKFLLARGYSESVAAAFARTLTKVKYRFYLSAFTYILGEDGFEMNMAIENFVELDNVRVER